MSSLVYHNLYQSEQEPDSMIPLYTASLHEDGAETQVAFFMKQLIFQANTSATDISIKQLIF